MDRLGVKIPKFTNPADFLQRLANKPESVKPGLTTKFFIDRCRKVLEKQLIDFDQEIQK